MIHANDRDAAATVMRADRLYPIVLMTWFFVALALGDSGRLVILEPPAPQVILLGLTALLLVIGIFRGLFALAG